MRKVCNIEMEDTNNAASNVARAIAALYWSSTPEARTGTVSYLESYLDRLMWNELSHLAHWNFANVTGDLMSEIADHCEKCALKSQRAALVAEIVRREGLNLRQDLIPSLASLSSKGSIQALPKCS